MRVFVKERYRVNKIKREINRNREKETMGDIKKEEKKEIDKKREREN